MADVIILSDSDESVSLADKRNKDDGISESNERYDVDVASDLDLPEVPFCREIATGNSVSRSEEDLLDLNVNGAGLKHVRHGPSYAASDSYDSGDNRVKKVSRTREAAACKKNKATLKEERLKRQRTLAREKALKVIAAKRSRDLKPGECMKFMEVNLDQGIDVFAFHTEIKNVLLNASIKFNVSTELIPNSITWQRNIEESYVDEDNKICVRKSIRTEEHVIVIWSNYEAAKHVAEGTLCTFILNSKALISNSNMTLVIFGMEEYFVYRKKARERSGKKARGKGAKCSDKDNPQFEKFPIISRQQLETCLTEAQIVAKCSSRLIENAQDLALMIYQYTKSISEIPYKLQKREHLENKFDWYVMGDNRNTVRVDKDGNGLKRLWQQQLCQFNLSSLEIAEAICTVYPSPAQLVQAYRNCTRDEGMNLLKDIPIRRAAGPLTAIRKVGPELSKKIYVMFMSQNGDALLGTEE